MPAITPEAVRELAGFKGGGAPVTTCYLDVDGRRYLRHQDYELQLDNLLRRAKSQANGAASVHQDLKRIGDYVRQGIDRSNVRGLAIFACSAQGLFEVVPLPVSVRNQVVINAAPAVGQLESVVHDRHRFGVLLADRQRARMFVYDMGHLEEKSALLDQLPRDYDQRGERERGDVSPHVDALTSNHLRKAAHVAFTVFQDEGFEHLCLGGPDEVMSQIESVLHPYLKERLSGHIAVTTTASDDDVRAAVRQLEVDEERRREARAVDQLREAVGSGHRGVAGLADVLAALNTRRVERLLVSEGYHAPGGHCPNCDCLQANGRRCTSCGAVVLAMDDVVEEALQSALRSNARVEVCVENPDLDVLGRIGAVLRF